MKCTRWEAYPTTLRCKAITVTDKPHEILVSVPLYVPYKIYICECSILQQQNIIDCCQY